MSLSAADPRPLNLPQNPRARRALVRDLPLGVLSLAPLFMAISSGAAVAQTAVPSCADVSGGVACTISAGTYTAPAAASAGALSVDDYGTFTLSIGDSTAAGVSASALGVAGADSSSSRAKDGSAAGYLSLIAHDSGAITVTGQASSYVPISALLGQAVGGNGGQYSGDDNAYDGGNGGSALGGVYVSNSQAITALGEFPGGLALVLATATGGDGGKGASGGSGGFGGTVQLENYAAVNIGSATSFVAGSTGGSVGSAISALQASSFGGSAGESTASDERFGGSGGLASVYSTAPVSVYWTWQGAGPGVGESQLYGVVAGSEGGVSSNKAQKGFNGGAGGSAYGAVVTLTADADVTVVAQNTAGAIAYDDTGKLASTALTGAAVAALSQGRDGGLTYGNDAAAGAGGDAGIGDTLTSVSITGAQVSVSGNAMAGVEARNAGGAGGTGNSKDNDGEPYGGSKTDGGAGGSAGALSVSLSNGTTITASGTLAPGVVAAAIGGVGGDGASYYGWNSDAGNGSAGGSADAVTVSLSNTSVATNGDYSAGIVALSIGGNGGNGGDRKSGNSGDAGGGGNAGSGGSVTVELGAGSSVTTNGYSSAGVIAYSAGGSGGNGGIGEVNMTGSPRNGGNGGSSGFVSATVDAGATITTQGDASGGLVAISISGFGGNGNTVSNVGSSHGGDGGTGGQAGSTVNGVLTAVEAVNNGVITTLGDDSAAIQAVAATGGGGGGGQTGGIFFVSAGTGASAGVVGEVIATNSATGSLSTSGMAAVGILAQSISGDGGNGGNLDMANTGLGGSAGFATNGGTVQVTNLGSILTTGFNGIGILAQSIGGGGGAGGSADNLASIGGEGGGGGGGGAVNVNAGGTISTEGDLAAAILAQSVGGGGGDGGNVTATSVGVSLAIGGVGGAGGAGGAVTLTGTDLAIKTLGSQSVGIVAQSVGGGGGVGGSAFDMTASAGFGAAVAAGGQGGDGGSAGAATVNLTKTTIVTAASVQDATNPEDAAYGTVLDPLAVDSYGVLVQSIGGGGGLGGASAAKAFVQDVTIPGSEGLSGFAVSLTYSAGGDGGGGGNGGTATLNLASDVSILTYGNGAHALMVQSIGGGGGTGGDSSSNSTTFGFKTLSKVTGQANYNVDLTLNVGSNGGTSGNGGTVNVTLGGTDGVADADAATDPVQIVTLGDAAYGVLAQSQGGGGGNAGSGSGSTQNGTSGSTALKFGLTLGGQGTGGGTGGEVNVTAFTGTSIQTYGDGAIGILAESTGGGGGNSGGGSFQLGLPSLDEVGKVITGSTTGWTVGKLTSSVTIRNGNTGGGGGDGGTVNVALTGTTVTTSAEGATGISAMSVGGGGGKGGSAGSSGSSDNPNVIDDLKADKKFVSGIANYMTDILKKVQDGAGWSQAMRDSLSNFLPSLNISLSLGGDGGTGGNGGTVKVSLTDSTVATLDDYAYGVSAQSVGGGGGDGGAAVAGGSSGIGSIMKLNANIALGSTGGAAGDGGAVSVTLADSVISTAGYASYGILAQSVGGGGGTAGSAQTNSSGYFSLGASRSLTAAEMGNGGSVTLASASGSGPTSITTAGDAAMAVFLQSIGGGGGVAGDGFTLTPGILQFGGDVSLSAGGSGVIGDGGAVTFDAANLPYLTIATSGANAYGILAQSIGGGGGLVFRQAGSSTKTGVYELGGATGYSNGGAVSVALHDDSSIATSGAGAHAIFAQSVGGGGGIVGFAGGTTTMSMATSQDGPNFGTSGNGGDVTVNTGNSSITTTGASAYGIFAQSVGAGGGVRSSNDGLSVIAGSTGGTGSLGSGGKVTITEGAGGLIYTTGENAVGIFAQSVGQNGYSTSSSGGVSINVNGKVIGGYGEDGTAIWVDSDSTTNSILISSTGFLSATSNLAIRSTGEGITNVTNHGAVAGNWDLTAGSTFSNGDALVATAKSSSMPTYGTFTNASDGTLVAGSAMAGHLVNDGTLVLGALESDRTTRLSGSLTQGESGVIIANADFAAGTIDLLSVGGDAELKGRVEVVASSLLPNRKLTFLEVDGVAVGTLDGSTSNVFDYVVDKSGSAYSVIATADFSNSGGSLNAIEQRVANYLQGIWNSGGSGYGSVFGHLSTLDSGLYANALSQLGEGTANAPAGENIALAQQHLDRLMSCPVFQGETAIVTQTSCMWAVGAGQSFDQSAFDGAGGYGSTTYSFAMGMQKEVASGWFLGLAGGYDDSRISSANMSIDGSSGWGGVTVKYETGPWLFAAALTGSYGSFDGERSIYLGTIGGIAKGTNDLWGFGGRGRIAYTVGAESFYARPFVDLDVLYNSMSGYTEMGAGVLDRMVAGSDQWTGLATPGVEVGARINLDPDFVLRGYARFGGTFSTTDSWTSTTALVGAPLGLGGLDVVLPLDTVYGRVGAGLDLAAVKHGMNLRAEYEGAFSEHTSRNMGTLRFSVNF
ncbi:MULTISPECIES: autotransporter outer membrane beta-barrel domain-containing protein [unclassified Xanthobacter]|uniref:autotransporter outer membrane beta-barrel domain-containing protein n=1 Tax=unclassified Xanthobacter TaxID=2623496 RepID=UPI001F3C1D7F|nr:MULTISPECIES: autotransporter outer membrane beta-barrel domain-containing protein [unclassified Xanthobacter]